MTSEEIIEGNKLITEYLGVKTDNWDSEAARQDAYTKFCFYHKSWDSLMPVLLKVLSENQSDFLIQDPKMISGNYNLYAAYLFSDQKNCLCVTRHSAIEAVWNAVVEYIKSKNNGKTN
jgi:hypothetical protein